MPRQTEPDLDVHRRLGYLLKHAAMILEGLNEQALAPFDIGSRELALLLTIARLESPSQHEAAEALRIDRTTMVAYVDLLEGKGLVARRPDPRDRRRNVVELTELGQRTLRGAAKASDGAERELLRPLGAAEGEELRRALRTIVTGHDELAG